MKKNKEYIVYKNVVKGLVRYVAQYDEHIIITPENGLYELVRLVYEFRESGYLVPLILYGLEIEKIEEGFKTWHM
ncbi:hypothetical protein [Lactococcus phage PLgY-30]|uniref:Uncharacterized protein n=2 Tax=Uwajimavirus PLgW1 TaxID=2845441 RepID=A0A2Z2P1V9_9CAUD|nr:hypothetical protein [Lactococcus phage PLgY-16]ASJ80073.1 hypothetical protein [Lactococcus phage PLgY-30]